MTLYLHPPPNEREVVRLAQWSIRRFEDGSMHFVGFCMMSHDGRVSTEISELDAYSRSGVTASGRHYELIGPSGFDGDAEYVWNMVAGTLGSGQAWKDISEDLIPGCRHKGSHGK
jgi:hypothetical protein